MRTVKVYFTNGDKIITSINGSTKEIREYYKEGKVFNIGNGERDKLSKVKKVVFLD